MNPLRRIGIVGRPDTAELRAPLEQLLSVLASTGAKVLVDQKFFSATQAEIAPQVSVVGADAMWQNVDAVIAMGGDGTMIGTARQAMPHDVAVIGINLGRLGFLTDIAASEVAQRLPAIVRGEYIEEQRAVLQANIQDETALAFNDVVIARGTTGSMIDMQVSVDDRIAYTLRADGLIVATPTGSTAYALSAAGPIVHPTVSAMLMVPVAPHALTNRPIVLPDSSVLEITLTRGTGAIVHADGQSRHALQAGESVRVRLNSKRVRLLHPLDYNYYAMLRQKLAWGETAEKFHNNGH